MRKTLFIIGAGILLALILIFILFFGGNKTPGQSPVLNPSTGTRTLPQPSELSPAGSSPGYTPPQGNASPSFQYYTDSQVPQNTGSAGTPAPTQNAAQETPPPFVFTFNTYQGPSIRQILNNLVIPQIATSAPVTYDGVTTPPAADMWPSQGDGIIRGGGTPGSGRPDYEFNPYTGDGRIGDYNFSLAMGTIVNGNTSNNAGDPDNLVFGTAIGSIIGSIVGMPELGLTMGTAVGSNLFPGYRLSNFGISVQGGIPTFDGIQPGVLGSTGSGLLTSAAGSLGGVGGGCLSGAAGGAAGGAVGGSVGGSVGGAVGGGGGYQGGMVISIPCTCSVKGKFWWTISSPAQYAGTYLFDPLSSKLYENYMFTGAFNNVGSHSSGIAYCPMYAGEDCIDVPMTCGKLNGSPGTGTSLSI